MRHLRRAATQERAAVLPRRGFTVIELMVTLTIVAAATAMAVPSFQSLFTTMRMSSYANELVAASMMARTRAISQNARVTMCQSADGANCGGGTGWESGYLVTCESNDGQICTNSPSGTPTVLVLAIQKSAAPGWRISEANGVTSIVFQPTGTGATAAALTVCRQNPLGPTERLVRISPTGRTSVTKTTNGVCN